MNKDVIKEVIGCVFVLMFVIFSFFYIIIPLQNQNLQSVCESHNFSSIVKGYGVTVNCSDWNDTKTEHLESLCVWC